MADILVPRDTFLVELDGNRIILHKGVTRVRAGHPLTVGREELFEPIGLDYDVEQATAAPGEKRSTRRPRKPSDRGEDVSEDG